MKTWRTRIYTIRADGIIAGGQSSPTVELFRPGIIKELRINASDPANKSTYRGDFIRFAIKNTFLGKEYMIPAFNQDEIEIDVASFRTADRANPLIFDYGLEYGSYRKIQFKILVDSTSPSAVDVNIVLISNEIGLVDIDRDYKSELERISAPTPEEILNAMVVDRFALEKEKNNERDRM